MAEEKYLPEEDQSKDIAENISGMVDYESFHVVQEISDSLPRRDYHNELHTISFSQEHEHIGLIASLIAAYLQLDPHLEKNNLTVPGITLDILNELHIPFTLQPETNLAETPPSNIIFLPTQKRDEW